MSKKCPKCDSPINIDSKAGIFIRKSDRRKVQRFKNKHCSHSFSKATFQKCYRQKKRHLNGIIFKLYCSGVSLRRIARLLSINRKTVVRKIAFLAKIKKEQNLKKFSSLSKIKRIQFDDLETIEHTKCKPLSVSLAVEPETRRILGFEVSQMPAKGHLASISVKKYGYREDKRSEGREKLFSKLIEKISPTALIESDQNPHYTEDLKTYFPQAQHIAYPGKRGCVAGQGELKKIAFDPLFT